MEGFKFRPRNLDLGADLLEVEILIGNFLQLVQEFRFLIDQAMETRNLQGVFEVDNPGQATVLVGELTPFLHLSPA